MKLLFLLFFSISLMYGNPVLGQTTSPTHLDPDLVTWKSLVYKSGTFFGTATAIVELNICRQPGLPEQHEALHRTIIDDDIYPQADRLCLSVTNTIRPYFSANRFYQTKVWFSPDDGTASRRLRLFRGKKYYLKDYSFTPSGVYRYRQTPRNLEEEKLKPELWSDTQKTFYSFPGKISANTIISEPSLILYYLSAKTLKSDSQPKEICVFHKKQYHMVTLIRKTPIRIQVDYIEQQDGQNKLVKKGEMQLASYRLISRPVKENDGTAAEKFSFMGLTGNITIYFDEEARIPIRIDGDIPLIGRVHFNLQQVMRANRK